MRQHRFGRKNVITSLSQHASITSGFPSHYVSTWWGNWSRGFVERMQLLRVFVLCNATIRKATGIDEAVNHAELLTPGEEAVRKSKHRTITTSPVDYDSLLRTPLDRPGSCPRERCWGHLRQISARHLDSFSAAFPSWGQNAWS